MEVNSFLDRAVMTDHTQAAFRRRKHRSQASISMERVVLLFSGVLSYRCCLQLCIFDASNFYTTSSLASRWAPSLQSHCQDLAYLLKVLRLRQDIEFVSTDCFDTPCVHLLERRDLALIMWTLAVDSSHTDVDF